MQKYTKIQASVQHGLYLFTCEIHSFNSTGGSNLQLPEKLKLSVLLAYVYISLYMLLHSYICLCAFAYFLCVFLYIS